MIVRLMRLRRKTGPSNGEGGNEVFDVFNIRMAKRCQKERSKRRVALSCVDLRIQVLVPWCLLECAAVYERRSSAREKELKYK